MIPGHRRAISVALAVAAALGKDWSARSRPDYGGSSAAVLLRGGEPLVSVYIGGYGRDASRIYFDGYMPADLMRHQPSQLLDQAREISVSGSRP